MADLVLVCRHCRWRPPGDLEMALVEAHFDMEPDHDPSDIKLELVAICDRCDLEMPLDRIEPRRTGGTKNYFTCTKCRRSKVVLQHEPGGQTVTKETT